MTRTITTILAELHYTECPRWHEGRLWFSDFYEAAVFSCTEDGSDRRLEVEVPEQPSGIGWLPDGRLLVVSMRDRRVLRREQDGSVVTHADLSQHLGWHANDMVVDDQGRAYVGSFGFDLMGGAAATTAGLVRVDPDGRVTTAAEDLWFPNGSVISDGTLLVDETIANRVSAFDIGADGGLSNRRVWAKFGEPPTDTAFEAVLANVAVAPDGCCLDAEGALWIADAVGGRVLRVREGGEILEEISPGTGAFACMLGGADGRTLFISAAPDFYEEPRKAAREAQVLAVRVDVPHGGRP